MTLIDGDRIMTAWLYDDEHREFIEKKMSIIDCINAYTEEGITESDVVEQTEWLPVSERLPEPRVDVWVNSDIGQLQGYYEEHVDTWYASFGQGRDYLELIVNAWMPLPEPYKAESE